MKRGKIFLYDTYAGLLTEDENGFTFVYDADFLNSDKAEAISLTLPLTDKPYHDTVLFCKDCIGAVSVILDEPV